MRSGILYFEDLIKEANCSVYSLPSGSIKFQDFKNGSWSQNFTDTFLPAYYLANCSIDTLLRQKSFGNLSSLSKKEEDFFSVYEKSDDGNAFVALLFTISGICVASWMLTLLMCLSPRHKRKPLLTQLATIFFSIVSTILISHTTRACLEEYYDEALDLMKIRDRLYVGLSSRVTLVISQFFTNVAWLQIIIHISKQRFKWYTGIFGAILCLVYAALDSYFHAHLNVKDMVYDVSLEFESQKCMTTLKILRLVTVIWFALSILYYTTVIKNPRKICYSKRLVPLALFTGILFIAYIVLQILSLSLFLGEWQVLIWLTLINYFLEISFLTAVWEWVFDIEFLEKRNEMMGTLGRRISLNDVITFNSREDNGIYENGNRGKQFLISFFRKCLPGRFKDNNRTNSCDTDILTTYQDASAPIAPHPQPEYDSSNVNVNNRRHSVDYPANDNNDNDNTANDTNFGREVDNSNQSSGSYDVQYVDDYDYSEDEHDPLNPNDQGTNSNPLPPPFHAHPGFHHDDYWHDEK